MGRPVAPLRNGSRYSIAPRGARRIRCGYGTGCGVSTDRPRSGRRARGTHASRRNRTSVQCTRGTWRRIPEVTHPDHRGTPCVSSSSPGRDVRAGDRDPATRAQRDLVDDRVQGAVAGQSRQYGPPTPPAIPPPPPPSSIICAASLFVDVHGGRHKPLTPRGAGHAIGVRTIPHAQAAAPVRRHTVRRHDRPDRVAASAPLGLRPGGRCASRWRERSRRRTLSP